MSMRLVAAVVLFVASAAAGTAVRGSLARRAQDGCRQVSWACSATQADSYFQSVNYL